MKFLRQNKDVWTLFWIAKYFLILGLGWQYDATLSNSVRACLIVLLSYYSFAGACITHNCMHCRVFYSAKLEAIFRILLSFTYGHPSSTFKSGHNLSHHRHLETKMDAMRTTKLQYRYHFLNLLLYQPTVAFSVMLMDLKYLKLMKLERQSFFVYSSIEWILVIWLHFLLLVNNWWCFLLYVKIPHLWAQTAIVTMNLLQHDGCDSESDLHHSRNFTGSVINFLTFNNGYHSIHHDKPNLHWSKLKTEHNRKYHDLPNNLNQKNMFGYIVKTFVYPGHRIDYTGKPLIVKEMGQDEDWIHLHVSNEKIKKEDFELQWQDSWILFFLLVIKSISFCYSPLHF